MDETQRQMNNLDQFPEILSVPGVEIGAVPAGLTYEGRHDLIMASFPEGTVSAGTFSKNVMAAAPIRVSQENLAESANNIRGLVVNAGNANACTGRRGMRTAHIMAETVAEYLDCEKNQVLVASTGIIGVTMAPGPVRRGLARLVGGLSASLYRDAADALRTEDTYPKAAFQQTEIDGEKVTIASIAKGAGIKTPDVATVMAFVFTDANISQNVLQDVIEQVTQATFGAVCVGGECGPNDCVLSFATRQSPHTEITNSNDPRLRGFIVSLQELCLSLAHQIVRDSGSSGKLVTVRIYGADNQDDAMKIAQSVAASPAVRLAVTHERPDWGALVAAAGRAGVYFDPAELAVHVGKILVAHKGTVHMRYHEEDAEGLMHGPDIDFCLTVGQGPGQARVWTGDLPVLGTPCS